MPNFLKGYIMAFFSYTTSALKLLAAVHIPFEDRFDFFDRLVGYKKFALIIGVTEVNTVNEARLIAALTSVFFCWTKYQNLDRAYAVALRETQNLSLAEHMARYVAKQLYSA